MLHCIPTICYHASTAVREEVQTEKSSVVEISLQTDDLLDSIASPVATRSGNPAVIAT